MGLGNDRKKYAYVTLRVQVGEGSSKVVDPAFVQTVKDEHGNWIQGEAFQYIAGELVGVKKDSYEWQGRTIPKVQLFIYDKGDDTIYKVECSYNGLIRSIMNSLMSIPDYKDIQILVYKKTLKEKQNQVVPGAVVRWNFNTSPEKASWVIPIEEITAKFLKVMIRGKEEVDTLPADEMVVNMAIDNILPKLRSLDQVTAKVVDAPVPIQRAPVDSPEETSMLDQVRKDRAEREADINYAVAEDEDTDLPF